jgi:hypothetical protein
MVLITERKNLLKKESHTSNALLITSSIIFLKYWCWILNQISEHNNLFWLSNTENKTLMIAQNLFLFT